MSEPSSNRPRRFRSSRIVWALIVLSSLILAYRYLKTGDSGQQSRFETVALAKGDLHITIGATGTVEPEEVIDIGAQVAGQISSLGVDERGKPIDYGSLVLENSVLAQIDGSLYAADAAQTDAQLKRAQAGVQQSQAKLLQAEQDWKRVKDLGNSKVIAQTNYDTYRANYQTAQADLAVSQAEVAQAEAALLKTRRNLEYCVIRSPVKGVIIDKRVNIGQTVVSSLNAPSLFLIAKDLARMQVLVAVNEADIGKIRPGQEVTFTVDAYPGMNFKGEVRKVRLNAGMSQNVVTYTVEVITDNTTGRLLPYLTANVQFHVEDRTDVLLAPNTALRWSPPRDPTANGAPTRTGEKVKTTPNLQIKPLWILRNEEPLRIEVEIGMSDGQYTEVSAKDLKEGDLAIVGTTDLESASNRSATNPFVPKMSRGGRH